MAEEHPTEKRSLEQLREQYEVERELADRLRAAPADARGKLYGRVYDELFRRVRHHPQLTRKASPQRTDRFIASQMAFLGRFLMADTVFLEIGAGDCALALHVARRVKQVYAVDVSVEISDRDRLPPNFAMCLSDGSSVPVPKESVDVAYSHQLVEHLHPDDAIAQLKNIVAALVPGGIYVCITPNRHAGPWDISKHFDRVASGLHLKEYSITELSALFEAAGLVVRAAYTGGNGRYVPLPVLPLRLADRLLDVLPYRAARAIVYASPVRSIRLLGKKPAADGVARP